VDAQETPAYREAKAPVEQRVADLLARMTLEEKVAQLVGTWQNKSFIGATNPRIVDEKGVFDAAQASVLLKYGLGEMSRPSENRGPREMAEFTNSIQKWLKENTRLGIPILFHEECLPWQRGAESDFVSAGDLALASTWDPALVQEVFTSVAAESSRKGSAGMSCASVGSRPRSAMGPGRRRRTAKTLTWFRGLEWRRFTDTKARARIWTSRTSLPRRNICGAWAAGSRHERCSRNYSERVIREYFLKPFEAAVREAHVATVMAFL